MARKSNSAVAGKDAAQSAATAPAVQLGNQPAGPIQGNSAGSATGQDAQSRKGSAVVLDDDGDIEGLWIEAIPEQGFRRLGYRFTREGLGIALSALSEEQIHILENEPSLKVERGTFSGLVE